MDDLTNRLKKAVGVEEDSSPASIEPVAEAGKSLRRIRREKAEAYDEMVLQVASLTTALGKAQNGRRLLAHHVEDYFAQLDKVANMADDDPDKATQGIRLQNIRSRMFDCVDDTLGGE
jgi:hypothetical protein